MDAWGIRPELCCVRVRDASKTVEPMYRWSIPMHSDDDLLSDVLDACDMNLFVASLIATL